jgi:hypothetical protein
MKLVEQDRTAELLAIDVVNVATQLKNLINIITVLDSEEEDYTADIAAAIAAFNAAIEPNYTPPEV